MKIPLKEIQNFNGNFYELVVAVIIRTDQIIEKISLGNYVPNKDKIVIESLNDILKGKYTYGIEEK